MTCHTCGCAPAIVRGAVSVCGDCGATSCDGRAAVYADLERLSAADLAALRQQRGRVAPHRKKSRG